MTEEPTPVSDEPVEQGSDEPPKEDVISRNEFEKVVGQRQRWKQLANEKDEQLESLQAQLNELKGGKRPKSDDKNPDIESLQHKIGNLEESNQNLAEQLRAATIDRDVLDVAGKHVSKPKLFLQLYRDRFEPFTDSMDGQVKTRVKNSGLSVEDLISEFVDEYPELKLNNRQPGTGAPDVAKQASANSVAKSAPAGFANWSREQKTEFFKQNPELGKEIAAGLLKTA